MRAPPLVCLFLVATLAGCAEGPPPEAPVEPAPLPDIGADQMPVDAPDAPAPAWFAGHKNGTDLAAFPFHVPDDAVVAFEPIPGFTFKAVVLELSIVTSAPLDAWAVYAFDLSGDEASAVGSVVATGSEASTYSLLPSGSTSASDAPLAPARLFMSPETAGSDIALVLATRGAPATVSLTWRVMDVYPVAGASYDAPEDHDAFVALRTGPAGVIHPLGVGQGFTFDAYVEVYVGLYAPIGLFGWKIQAGEVEVTEEMDTWVAPYGGVRRTSLRMDGHDHGWSRAQVLYWPGNGGGWFDTSVTAHEAAVSDTGVAVATRAPVSVAVQPLLYAYAVGGGNGTSGVSLDLTAGDTNDFFILSATTESFGTSLDRLLGKPARSDGYAWPGLVVPSPQGILHLGDAPAHLIVR